MIGSRLRLFWWIYVPLAVVLLAVVPLFLAAGPAIEQRFLPVRTEQRIENVARVADRVCWEWVSVKVRSLVSDDIDLHLDVNGLPGAVGAPFERDTGMPWVRSRAVGIGPHRQPYCVMLPPYVHADTPIRIRQTAWYPGWHGLWRIRVDLPDIVDPAGSIIQ